MDCWDVDECQLGTHTCGEDATCANTEGSFRCLCAGLPCPGTSLPAHAQERGENLERIDHQDCPPSHEGYCLHGGQCMYFEMLMQAACRCPVGYSGARCEFVNLGDLRSAHIWQPESGTVAAACLGALVLLLLVVMGTLYCGSIRKLFLDVLKKPRAAPWSREAGVKPADGEAVPQPWFVGQEKQQDLRNGGHPAPLQDSHGPEAHAGQRPLQDPGSLSLNALSETLLTQAESSERGPRLPSSLEAHSGLSPHGAEQHA